MMRFRVTSTTEMAPWSSIVRRIQKWFSKPFRRATALKDHIPYGTLNNLDGTLDITLETTLDTTLECTLDGTLETTLGAGNALDHTLDGTLETIDDNTLDGTLETILDNTLECTLDGTMDTLDNGNALDHTLDGSMETTLDAGNALDHTLDGTLETIEDNTLDGTLEIILDSTLADILDNQRDGTVKFAEDDSPDLAHFCPSIHCQGLEEKEACSWGISHNGPHDIQESGINHSFPQETDSHSCHCRFNRRVQEFCISCIGYPGTLRWSDSEEDADESSMSSSLDTSKSTIKMHRFQKHPTLTSLQEHRHEWAKQNKQIRQSYAKDQLAKYAYSTVSVNPVPNELRQEEAIVENRNELEYYRLRHWLSNPLDAPYLLKLKDRSQTATVHGKNAKQKRRK